MKITNPEQPDQHYPDFEFTFTSLKVNEVIHTRNPSDSVTPQQVIKLAPAYIEGKLTVHRRYHVDHTRKRPIYERYQSSSLAAGEKANQMVYFLRRCGIETQKYWCLALIGAKESVKRVNEIRALLKTR